MQQANERSPRGPRPDTGIRWWPSLLGVVCGVGASAAGNVPAIILVCVSIYVLAAVTARPGSAWIGFAASLPLIGIGRVLGLPWLSIVLIGAASVVLVVIGGAHHVWRTRENRRQLLGILLFALSAVAVAAIGSVPLAGALAILALIGHAAWDLWHHVRPAVVARPYAEFCAVLDASLAVVIAVALVAGAGSGRLL